MPERKRLHPHVKASLPQRRRGRIVVVQHVKPGGSLYRDGMAEMAYKLCLLGATDDDLADAFDVDKTTINDWINRGDSFCDAVRSGREVADANVAKALYKRAIGYSHPSVKIFYDRDTGEVIEVPYTEYYPPDTAAIQFWLRCRQRHTDRWNPPPPDGAPIPIQVPMIVINPVQAVQVSAAPGEPRIIKTKTKTINAVAEALEPEKTE